VGIEIETRMSVRWLDVRIESEVVGRAYRVRWLDVGIEMDISYVERHISQVYVDSRVETHMSEVYKCGYRDRDTHE